MISNPELNSHFLAHPFLHFSFYIFHIHKVNHYTVCILQFIKGYYTFWVQYLCNWWWKYAHLDAMFESCGEFLRMLTTSVSCWLSRFCFSLSSAVTSRSRCSTSVSRRRRESTVRESTASCPACSDPTPSPSRSRQNSKVMGSGGELLEYRHVCHSQIL